MQSAELVPPGLSQGESYHVFCSYSSTDSQWTHALIQYLEDRGLMVCEHERDFIPGRPILNNMSDSIQQSQKVLLILSEEFVRSRWCLLEANMSMFKDCLQRKPIVPVLLQREVHIPLHLAHLTYLDVQQPDFGQQLLRVLCTPNQEMQSCTVVPYQPPSLYNGKSLEPLTPVNEEQLSEFSCGEWSDTVVPQQLRLIIQQPQRYREAIGIINTVSQTKVKYRTSWSQNMYTISWIARIFFCGMILSALFAVPGFPTTLAAQIPCYVLLVLVGLWGMYKVVSFRKKEPERIMRELQKAIGQANSLLFEEHVLLGSQSNSKLLLVYVSVEGCRETLCALDQEQEQEQDFFHAAIQEYSCGYACCLAKRYFPFQSSFSSSHLKGGVCFCQYVAHHISVKNTPIRCCNKPLPPFLQGYFRKNTVHGNIYV